MINVLQLCSQYPGSNIYDYLFNCLNSKGVRNYVFIPCRENAEKKILNNDKTKLIYEESFKAGKTLVEKFTNIFNQYYFFNQQQRIYNKLIKKISISEIDYIHAHTLFTDGYLAYMLNKNFNKKYIVAVRNTDVNSFLKYGKHLRNTAIKIIKNAEKVIFISESYRINFINKFLKSQDEKNLSSKFIVIPNGIDDFWLKNKVIYKKQPNNKLNLIQVGRIDKNKNVETAIKVCEELRNSGIEANITIVGNGPLRKELIKRYNSNYIVFKDFAKKEELINYYDEAHVFIMLSKFETFGLVYVEAMSRGLPLIYTKNQGFDKTFKDGKVGFPIEYDNYKMATERIKDILNRYSDMSSNCLNNLESFSWDIIAKRYKAIYECR